MDEFLQKYKTHLRGLPKSRTRLIYINTREDEDEEEVIMKIQRVQTSYTKEKLKRREKYKQMKTLLEKSEADKEKALAEEAHIVANIALEQAHRATKTVTIHQKAREKPPLDDKTATIKRIDRQKIHEETLKKEHEYRLKEAEMNRKRYEEREAIKRKEREYALMRQQARNEEETPDPVEGIPSKHDPLQSSPNIFKQIEPVHIDNDIKEFERMLYSNYSPVDVKPDPEPLFIPRNIPEVKKEPEPEEEDRKDETVMTVDMVQWNPRLNKRISKIGWYPDEIKDAICDRINNIIKKVTTETDSTRDNSYYFKAEPPGHRNKRLIQNGIDSTYRHFHELLDTYERKAQRGRYIPCERVCRMINP